MPTNVEVKARTDRIEEIAAVARRLSGAEPQILAQTDTFFRVGRGRLKLRVEARPGDATDETRGELIAYERADAAGPRRSDYRIYRTCDPVSLTATLSSLFEIAGVVRKTRRLFQVGATRVHLDEVDGLGNFVELETVLAPNQTASEGSRIAEELMRALGIRAEDLVDRAYVDLLQERGAAAPLNSQQGSGGRPERGPLA